MTHREPTDPYNRVHIGPDKQTVLEHCTTDLDDEDPVALMLEQFGVDAVTLRFVGGSTLTYSKRATS